MKLRYNCGPIIIKDGTRLELNKDEGYQLLDFLLDGICHKCYVEIPDRDVLCQTCLQEIKERHRMSWGKRKRGG